MTFMVRIEKNEMTFNFIEYDENGNEFERSVDVFESGLGLVSYLTFPIEIEEGVTVEDLMNFLKRDAETTNVVFDSSLGGHSFSDFLKEMDDSELYEKGHLVSMEIGHDTDIMFEGEMDLFSVPRLRGISKDGDMFSVEFASLASYMKLPVSLNEMFTIRVMKEDGTEANSINMRKSFTLFDVFHSILYEMSYYGTPEMRQACLEDLLEENEHFIEQKEEVDNVENLMKKLDHLIELEEYEAAARVRDRIRQIKDGTKPDKQI